MVALVATIQSSLMAQNIKTYNGALCKPNTMICALDVEVFNEVSYEYYENENYARVWHGRFTAHYFRYKDDHSVVGCYEHGVQSGVWKESGVFYDKQGYLSYNFLNGKLHGDYHFESDDLVISAMFCDNHLSGSISVVGQNGQFFLSGQFDEDGFACGEWEVKYLGYNRIPFIREYVYDKGQVLSIVEIDDSTGERTTYSDQNGEDRRLLSYSGLDSWFLHEMPLYYLLSRRFVNPFKNASYNAEGYNTTAVYHTVEAGDTFGHLAVKYETSSKRIQELNPDVDPAKLQIGQKIRVKGGEPAVKEEKAVEAPKAEPTAVASGDEVYHTIESGDIFKDLEKNKDEVASVDADKIATSDDNAVDHVIAEGESFSTLAKQYNTTTDRIQKLNPDVDPRKIYIGQKIRVKGNKPLITEENILEKEHKVTPNGWGDAKSGNDRTGKYKGACTVAYCFTDPVRNHKSLYIPAYTALGGGVVVLDVTLDRNGAVTNARVASSTNSSLNQIALQAARNYRTRFNIDGSAPASHKGTITFTFLTLM